MIKYASTPSPYGGSLSLSVTPHAVDLERRRKRTTYILLLLFGRLCSVVPSRWLANESPRGEWRVLCRPAAEPVSANVCAARRVLSATFYSFSCRVRRRRVFLSVCPRNTRPGCRARMRVVHCSLRTPFA